MTRKQRRRSPSLSSHIFIVGGLLACAVWLGGPAWSSVAATRSADLAAGSFLFLPGALAANDHPIFAAFVLVNNGPDALLDDSVSYTFFLSRSPTFDTATATQFGTVRDMLRLGAGEYAAIVLTEPELSNVTFPPDASGSYYVFVRVQAAAVDDPDLSNNTSRRQGQTGVLQAPVAGDFDGDRKNDPALFEEASGKWQVKLSASGYASATLDGLGAAGYIPICGDYDGDRKTDPAVYDTTTGNWNFLLSASGYAAATLAAFGGVGYAAVPADFDGDGKADPAIYHEATGAWQVKMSGSYYATAVLTGFGACGNAALAADFDGDGKADPAIFQAATGNWIVKLSGSSYTPAFVTAFGGANCQPLAGLFDSDTRADAAVYNLVNGMWEIMLSAGDIYNIVVIPDFGGAGYAPVCGDYDGDGLADPAVYQSATSIWFLKLSSANYNTTVFQQ
jgi:hypothetical protein